MNFSFQIPHAKYGGRHTVTVLPGDGIGPEMLEHVKRIFAFAHVPVDFEVIELDSRDVSEHALDNAIMAIQRNGVALKGNIETKFDNPESKSRNVELRRRLDLFANVLHCVSIPTVKCKHNDLDIVLIRENTEGEYSGLEHESVKGVVESIKKPKHGLTNKTYFLNFNQISKKRLVLRIDGKNTEEYIDRSFEFFAICLLSKSSLASKILLKFNNGMISEFLPGKELTPGEITSRNISKEVKDYGITKKIAIHLASLHKVDIEKIPEISERKPFILNNMQLYYNKVPEKFSKKENQEKFEDYFKTKNVGKDVSELSTVIEEDCRKLFCLGHNDLVIGNLLYDAEEGNVKFIDFEYVEKNFKQADIGNLFTGSVEISTKADYDSGFSPEGKRNFIKMYLEEFGFSGEELEKEVEIWMKEITVFEAAAHLLWSVWALFQAEHSPHDFDFIGYAIHRHKIIEKIAKFAFEYAVANNRNKITAVHKANIQKLGDGLFLKVCREMAQKDYPQIQFESMIVDNASMQLVSRPQQFNNGVMLMPNLYGNIISNIACGLVGGPGLVSGMNIGEKYAVFETGTRNTGTSLAGKDVANPTAFIRAAIDMLRYLEHDNLADKLSDALLEALTVQKLHTSDIGGNCKASELINGVIENLRD
ncbi:hypothetical protein FO519_006438 [Halicephalobus sp. NKZ332]|nr:hypothetical protein FO519_006438 [Halicephalobus sp. NKZ332]